MSMRERERRALSLKKLALEAERLGPSSTAAAHWSNFLAATSEVERIRSECRAQGRVYRDPWCCNEWALGARMEAEAELHEWVDWSLIAPRPAFIEDGYSAVDVRQGEVGDCCLLAAAACMCDSPELLDSLFITAEPNAEGVYCLRFWIENAWTWVVTDSRFLVIKGAHRTVQEPGQIWQGPHDVAAGKYAPPVGAHAGDMNDFWLAFLEKAWAKHHGNYSEIWAGTTSDALLAFLPHAASHTRIDFKAPSDGDGDGLDSFLKVSAWLERGWPVCLSSVAASEADHADSNDAMLKDGIVRGHAFTVVRTCRVPMAAEAKGHLDLIQLRNP